jgi:hypothetical protein
VACGPPVDPLAATRDAYREALSTDATQAPAHALVRASDEAVGQLVADLALGAPLTAPGPFGMKLVLLPEVTSAVAHTSARAPLEVRAELAGTTDIVFPLLSAKDLGWTSTISGALHSWTDESPEGLSVGVRWHDPDAVDVTVGLDGAPEQVVAMAEGAVRGAVTATLTEGVGFVLPPTPWARVRDLRLVGTEEGLLAELVLSGLGGAPPPMPDLPEQGMVLAISDDTLLGVAQALAVEQQPPGGKLMVEPIELTLSADGVDALIRVHRKARRPRWRSYRLSAPLIWEGESLSLPVEQLQLEGQERWKGGWRVGIGERRAVALLQDGLGEVPTTLVAPIGERALHVELVELQTVDGALRMVGRVDLP